MQTFQIVRICYVRYEYKSKLMLCICIEGNNFMEAKNDEQRGPRLWGGRFSQTPHEALESINRSIDVDRRLYEEDIQGSVAYASALRAAGVITVQEEIEIHHGLKTVLAEWHSGKFIILPSDEDIHTSNERRLTELVGTAGAKLHTGRSRNDQVITDTRLWVNKATIKLGGCIEQLIESIMKRAELDIDVLMPGYTHLQRAQPVRWSHFLLSHAWSLRADRDRLDEVRLRTMAEMPLGSGALAGTPLSIDRHALAHSLGFSGISNNSIHAVADRDFVVEFVFWASLTSTHLSRLAEDMLLFCTEEFGLVTLGDSLTTGSSLMPQKRNPDGLELVRAKSAAISGQCSMLLSLLKGLPSTYNKDLQLDKASMFTAYDDLLLALQLSTAVINTIQVRSDKCQAALSPDMLATDLAYYLVRKGVAFRDAHHIVGEVVRLAEHKKQTLCDVSLTDLSKISQYFTEDVTGVWSFESSVEQYQVYGGTSRASVQHQLQQLQDIFKNWRNIVHK